MRLKLACVICGLRGGDPENLVLRNYSGTEPELWIHPTCFVVAVAHYLACVPLRFSWRRG